MRIVEGTRAGAVSRIPGPTTTEMRLGAAKPLGPVEGVPVWLDPGGLRLLILVPFGIGPLVVKKGGVRQAGAFLLEPEESFAVGGPSWEEEHYTFRAPPSIEVVVERGELCSFCRSSLETHGAVVCSMGKLRGEVLCHACAEAWGIDAEKAGSEGKPATESRLAGARRG